MKGKQKTGDGQINESKEEMKEMKEGMWKRG